MSNENVTIEAVPPLWYQKYLNPKHSILDYTILITGETGTCRDVLAKAIHNNCINRSTKPFVAIKCTAHYDENLLEKKISETGGGTLFLDEISEISEQLQLWLLSIIDKRIIENHSNIRIIAGTKNDLKQNVDKGEFREDLLYKLNPISIKIQPLRDRKQDLSRLVNHLIEFEICTNNFLHIDLDPPVIQLLEKYDWPANLIELQRTVKYAIAECNNNLITIHDLPDEIKKIIIDKPKRGPSPKLDLESVKEALIKAGGNKAKAAKSLGVCQRSF